MENTFSDMTNFLKETYGDDLSGCIIVIDENRQVVVLTNFTEEQMCVAATVLTTKAQEQYSKVLKN
jgi:hypothetical protein